MGQDGMGEGEREGEWEGGGGVGGGLYTSYGEMGWG